MLNSDSLLCAKGCGGCPLQLSSHVGFDQGLWVEWHGLQGCAVQYLINQCHDSIHAYVELGQQSASWVGGMLCIALLVT